MTTIEAEVNADLDRLERDIAECTARTRAIRAKIKELSPEQAREQGAALEAELERMGEQSKGLLVKLRDICESLK